MPLTLVRLALVLFVLLVCMPAAAADPKPPKPPGPFDHIEDPRVLEALGTEAVAAGDLDRARLAFERMLARQEIRKYIGFHKFQKPLHEALVLERLGQHDEAAAKYVEGIEADVFKAIQVLRIMSVHPERDALAKKAFDHVRALAAEVKDQPYDRNGKGATGTLTFYTTSKGASRHLTAYTLDALLEANHKDDRLRYCYLDSLDLTAVEELPEVIRLDRCIVGNILIPDKDVHTFIFRGIVLGDTDAGKVWLDRDDKPSKNKKGRTVPASRFEDLMLKETVFLGHANFAGVDVTKKRAYFPIAVFEPGGGLQGRRVSRRVRVPLRVLRQGGRLQAPSHARAGILRRHTFPRRRRVQRSLQRARRLLQQRDLRGGRQLREVRVEALGHLRGQPLPGPRELLEDAPHQANEHLQGPFHGPLSVKESFFGGLDAFGSHFRDEAFFNDGNISGRTRFSLDSVTRERHQDDLDPLLPLYRDYQGDEDADAPLTTKSSYGVQALDDLVAPLRGRGQLRQHCNERVHRVRGRALRDP